MHELLSEYVVDRPAPRLRPFVERYVGYRLEGFEPGFHVGAPSRFLTFVVSLGSPVDIVSMPNPAQAPQRLFALVSGLCASPAVIRHYGNEHGVQLEVKPAGARALFGLPAAELSAVVLDLTEALGPLAGELQDRPAEAVSWSTRFAVLDDVLLRAVRDRAPARPEVAYAWDRLVASAGSIPVGALASEIGWSRRHLSERFRDEFGLPPKLVAEIVRFERARGLLMRPDRSSLARIAAECGYADQAHLTRDFRRYAGASPSAWLQADELPFVQDEAPAGALA